MKTTGKFLVEQTSVSCPVCFAFYDSNHCNHLTLPSRYLHPIFLIDNRIERVSVVCTQVLHSARKVRPHSPLLGFHWQTIYVITRQRGEVSDKRTDREKKRDRRKKTKGQGQHFFAECLSLSLPKEVASGNKRMT